MTIEIIPPGASAVVTEHKHGYEGSRHPDRWDLSTEMQRDLNYVRTQAEKEFIETTNQAERNEAADVVRDALSVSKVQSSELNTQKGLDYGFRETMLRADSHSEKSQKQVSDFYAASLIEAAKNASASLVDSAKNAAAITLDTEKHFNSLEVQAGSNTAGLTNQLISNFNLASVQAQNFANLASVQATSQFNALNIQTVMNASAVALQNQTIASAAQLDRQQIAAAAAAAAAECCCELKEAIGAEGQKTRDLMNATTENNLRDRAARSEAALAAYFAAKVAPTSPIS